ncbi:AAA family ATPase [Gemmiger sp.]|uniref:ATP-binding protein n=1 Tax=Gemmiger sp. TaxID=2049027 RepID=UPI003AF59B2C
MSVTITALEAENVKRIKAVEITPAPTGLTLVGGNNNQGKTSVLDALAWALGGDKFRPAAAARDGAITPPHLKVTLSNGIVVERRGKNSTLTVTDPTGRRAGQQLLNEFVEVLALDLPRFMDASDRDKADTLLKIIGVGEQLTAMDQRIKALYDKRTAVGQIAQQKKAYAEEMLSYPEAPAEPVSALELIQQQQEILLRNAENQRQRDRLAEVTHAKHRYADELQRLDERIEALQAQRRELKASYDAAVVAEESATKTVAQLRDESTAALEESIRNVEDTNRKVRANLDKARAEDEAAEMSAQYSKLTDQITEARRKRTALLDSADLPLPGLGVEDGCLTYHGKHWRDMSGSDQLRVATAIVRRLNPNCGFVLLDKLEQMDLATLVEFGHWLETEGLQAIATRVSTGSECQIIIEDGRVKEDTAACNTVLQAPADTPAWKKGAF